MEHDIDAVISGRGYQGSYRSPEAEPTRDDANGRRGGLGRGLDTLIPVANEESAPAHLQEVARPAPAADGPDPARGAIATTQHLDEVTFAKVSIEENAKGVWVRVEDSLGRSATAEVGHTDTALDDAIATAVAGLRRTEAPRILSVELRRIEGSDVLSVVLELRSRRRIAGAAVLEGGQPFTLGKAVWSALASVD